jgi:hypothetical protein
VKSDSIFGNDGVNVTKKRQRIPISQDTNDRIKSERRKTESITFRLDSDILDRLRQEARRKDISVNTLVTQITKQHANWHSIAAQAGFITVRKQLITKLLETHNEEQMKSLAEHIAKISNKDFILMLRRQYNIHSVLDSIETWVRISGYPYTHNTKDLDYDSMSHLFVIQHQMGIKWSLYLAYLYRNLFEEFAVRNAQFDTTDSTLTFEVIVPRVDEGYLTRAKSSIENRYERSDGLDFKTYDTLA